MKNKKGFLLLFLMLVFPALACNPLFNSAPKPTDYVARPGDCYVPAQGDPVTDYFYANEVNGPNCKAFVDQGQGKLLEGQAAIAEAQSRAVQAQVNKANTGNLFGLLGGIFITCLVVVFIGLGIYAVVH